MVEGYRQSNLIVANCSDIPHDPDEIIRKPAVGSDIDYDWNLKHK